MIVCNQQILWEYEILLSRLLFPLISFIFWDTRRVFKKDLYWGVIYINSSTYLKCANNSFDTHVYTCSQENLNTIKTGNKSTTPQIFLCFFVIPPSCKQTPTLYICFHFLEFYINEVIQYMLFFVWFLSHNMISLRFSHGVLCIYFWRALHCISIVKIFSDSPVMDICIVSSVLWLITNK